MSKGQCTKARRDVEDANPDTEDCEALQRIALLKQKFYYKFMQTMLSVKHRRMGKCSQEKRQKW